MINAATVIEQPYSGEYKERIYDIESPWNSSKWTWIKFDDDDKEWCGEFRGVVKGVVLSKKYNCVFILTSDYLYVLSSKNGDIVNYQNSPQYNSIILTPYDDVLVYDDYSILIISQDLDTIEEVPMPFVADMITFQGWQGNRLKINCCEFLGQGNLIDLYSTWNWNEETNSYEILWSDK